MKKILSLLAGIALLLALDTVHAHGVAGAKVLVVVQIAEMKPKLSAGFTIKP